MPEPDPEPPAAAGGTIPGVGRRARDLYEITQEELERFKALKALEKIVEAQLPALRRRILDAANAQAQTGASYIEPGQRVVRVVTQNRTIVDYPAEIDARWGAGQAAVIKQQTRPTPIEVLYVD